MSQRRQDARRAQQERRRQERRDARVRQRRTTPSITVPAAASSIASARPGAVRAATPLQKGRRPRGRYLGAGVAAAVLVALAAFLIYDRSQPLPGQKFESNGAEHTEPGQPHGAYFSNPPTSGWHFAPIPRPGIYTEPQPPENLGHFMEHGGVWVLYSCPDGCQDVVDQLKPIVDDALQNQWPVALAPYPPPGYPLPEQRINVIAWQYKLSMDEVDKAKVGGFVGRMKCNFLPEGSGPGCVVGKRGSTGAAKDAGDGGFPYVAPPSLATAAAAATPAPTPTPSPTTAAVGPTVPPATTTPTP